MGRAAVAALLTLALSAILSGGIEWLQAYSPSRVSSLIDLTCNLLGTAVGIVIGGAVQWTVPRLMTAALHEFHLRPRNSLCVAYCGALVVIAAMPFSLSLDPGLFKKSLKSADSTFVPFGVPGTVARHDSALAFWRSEALRKEWGRYFELREILPCAIDGFQTLVVLERPAAT